MGRGRQNYSTVVHIQVAMLKYTAVGGRGWVKQCGTGNKRHGGASKGLGDNYCTAVHIQVAVLKH